MALEEAGVRLEAENLGPFLAALDRATDAVNRFADSTEQSSGKVNVAQAAITGAFNAIAGVAVEAFGRALEAVADFVGGSIEAAADFEQGMSVLRVTSGATEEQMRELNDAAIALGNDLKLPTVSAQDAQEAMLELVKGGLSVENAMDAARGSLILATAAETDAGEAAQITAGILNAFGLEGDQATRVVDLLAGAAAKGAGEISDYAQGFQQAGFAFHAAGFPAEDLATSLQTLIEAGLGGSDAGTALKNAMMRLQNPTKEASKLMEGLGINVYDASGTMKPFPEIIGILNNQLGGMTQEQRNAALGTIFLGDGMKAMIPLLEGGTAAFEERRKKLSEAGIAEELAAAQTEGFNGAQARLQSQLDTMQLVIGQRLIPILTDFFTNVLSPGVNTVMSMVDAFFAAGGGADQLAAAVQPVLTAFSYIIPAFQDAGAASIEVGETMANLFEKLGLPAEAAKQLSDVFTTAFTAIQTIVDSVIGYVQVVMGVWATFIENNGDEIMGFIQITWDAIMRIVDKAIRLISAVITLVFTAIAEFIDEHGTEIQAILEAAWEFIKTVIETVTKVIEGIINVFLAIVEGDWDTAWTAIQTLTEDLLGGIRDIINTLIKLIESIINLALAAIKEDFENTWGEVLKGVERKWAEITGAIQGKLNDIKAAAENIVKEIISFFEQLPGRLASIASSAMDSLINGLNSRLGAIRGAIQGILDSIANIDLNPFDNATNRTGSLFGGVNASATTDQIYSNAKGLPSSSTSYTRNYNLALHTMQASGGVMRDFAIMEALAG